MPKIVYAKDFGFTPNCDVSASKRICELISKLDKSGAELFLEEGIYHFYFDDCAQSPFYITNTASERDVLDVTRNIAVLFENAENVVLNGNNAKFIIHGEMTSIAVHNCKNITIKNLCIDYDRPSVSEMEVRSVGINCVDVKINDDCPYQIVKGKLIWKSNPKDYVARCMQLCDRKRGITFRIPSFLTNCKVKKLEDGAVRMYSLIPKLVGAEVGDVLQARNYVRTEVGALIDNSDDINFQNVNFNYMHGLGIVGQLSGNMSFNDLTCAPNPESKRTCACFADFMHFSTCHGKISVTNSVFDGAQDDVINVHGGYLMITERIDDKTLLARFPHKDAYGFDAFKDGDTVEFVKKSTLSSIGMEKIASVEKLNPREFILTFENPLEKAIKVGVGVENITQTPELYVDNCIFRNIPTRGILVTTRRKVEITNNVFERTGMSGILISNDMGRWYESGRVLDVKIEGNTFIKCGHSNGWATILIKPENLIANKSRPVHRNIEVKNNVFELEKTTAIYAKSTHELKICGNIFKGVAGKAPLFKFLACDKVSIANKDIQTASKKVKIRKSRIEHD